MDRKNYKALILFGFLLVLFTACKKDETRPNNPAPPPPVAPGEDIAYVVCEGSFGNGNSSLALYKPSTNTTEEDLYYKANNKFLGDVFQSMTRIGDKLFLCVNNSDKVIVVNETDWKQVAEMNIPKPRYILPVTDTKAYVSTLYSNKIYIINPKSFSITGTISLPSQNAEDMLLYQGRVYVCAWDVDNTNVYGIDPATDRVSFTFDIQAAAPQEIAQDKDGMLWVLSGNVSKSKTAKLTQIHPNSGFILKSFTFPAGADPVRLEANNGGDMLYFIGVDYNGTNNYNGVYRMSIDASALPATPFISATQNQYYWALGIDPATDDIYVGDPKGFIQKGNVSVYSPGGAQKAQFNTGVGPGHFLFD